MTSFIAAVAFVLAVSGLLAQAAADLPARSRALTQAQDKCYLGCYADAFEYRAVRRFLAKDYKAMSVEFCKAKAISRNYKIFAVQYGRECWVSKGLKRAMRYGFSEGCNYTCTGNPNDICGGYLAFNLYTVGPCSPPPSPPLPPSPPTPPPPPPDYEITLVFANTGASFCNVTRDAFYNDALVSSGAKNQTRVRCSNSTGAPILRTSIQVNVRFGLVEDLNVAVNYVLNFANGAAAAIHQASGQGCDAGGSGDTMYMLVTNSTQIPGSTVVYNFACGSEGTPPITDGKKKWTYMVNAPFMCCSAH